MSNIPEEATAEFEVAMDGFGTLKTFDSRYVIKIRNGNGVIAKMTYLGGTTRIAHQKRLPKLFSLHIHDHFLVSKKIWGQPPPGRET